MRWPLICSDTEQYIFSFSLGYHPYRRVFDNILERIVCIAMSLY